MSLYFEKARELGEMIRESEESVRLADARTAFGAGAEAALVTAGLRESGKTAQNSEGGAPAAEKTAAFASEPAEGSHKKTAPRAVRTVRKRPDAPIPEPPICREAALGELLAAEKEYRALLEQVVDVLRMTVLGDVTDEPGEGRCGGCGGCGKG
ncbi:MAG: YlbF family regulator [Firmicutes bacterium]|nr:YlbF family regulator [Bacillota bacterium]